MTPTHTWHQHTQDNNTHMPATHSWHQHTHMTPNTHDTNTRMTPTHSWHQHTHDTNTNTWHQTLMTPTHVWHQHTHDTNTLMTPTYSCVTMVINLNVHFLERIGRYAVSHTVCTSYKRTQVLVNTYYIILWFKINLTHIKSLYFRRSIVHVLQPSLCESPI